MMLDLAKDKILASEVQLETAEGFDFTGDNFDSWAKEIGFREMTIMPLTGPSSVAIAIK